MKFFERSCFVLAAIVISLANIGSAIATQPQEGTAFDTLKSGCQETFPLRKIDRSRPRIVVVDKSTFCLYVLQRNKRGRVVATMATATSLGYDLRNKNGKYVVADIEARPSLFKLGRLDPLGSGNVFYPDHADTGVYGAATVTLHSVSGSNGHYYRRRTLLIHGTDEPLNVGGLTWYLPGVTLLNEDVRALTGQIYKGSSTYVVENLSDIGL